MTYKLRIENAGETVNAIFVVRQAYSTHGNSIDSVTRRTSRDRHTDVQIDERCVG